MPRKPARKSQAKRKTAAPSVRKSGAQGADAAPAPIPVRHGRFDYSPIVDRPPLRWPNGARVAVWVIPNIEHFLFDRPSTSISDATYALRPDVLNYSWRDFGVRVGIWRMMEIMEKYGVRGTVALNSDVCREYPRIIEEGNRLGWEWMGHGTTNSTLLSRLPEKEERALIKEAVNTIGEPSARRHAAGSARRSARSVHTLDILAENGVEYVGNWVNDEQPYPMKVKKGRMFSMPYSSRSMTFRRCSV